MPIGAEKSLSALKRFNVVYTVMKIKNLRSYCTYTVYDLATGEVLAYGGKYKDFSRMRSDCSFRSFSLIWRKIYTYSRFAAVGGRTCYIVYWTDFKRKRYPFIGSFVSFYGVRRGLSGRVINLWSKEVCDLSAFNLPQVSEG